MAVAETAAPTRSSFRREKPLMLKCSQVNEKSCIALCVAAMGRRRLSADKVLRDAKTALCVSAPDFCA